MIKEFKDFIMRGNVLELAIAVIIAGAFGAIITTFTNEVLMPPIGMALNGVDFADLMYVLQPEVKDAAGEVTQQMIAIKWGKLVNDIINFLIVAFILFLIIKAYNRANPPEEAPPAPAGPTQEELLTEIRDLLKK